MSDAISSAEELPREFSYYISVVRLATEHIEIRRVRLICKMSRYQRSLYQLHHRVSRHALVLPEMHNQSLTEPLHLYEIAKLGYELLDLLSIADGVGIAIIDIYARCNSPYSLIHRLINKAFCFHLCSPLIER